MRKEQAIRLAQDALERLLADETTAVRFLSETGLEPQEMRARLDDATFLGFALDYFVQDEERAVALCADHGLNPEQFAAARASLPSGDAPHWT